MGKPNKNRIRKDISRNVKSAWDNKKTMRRELWSEISTQEQFDKAVRKLLKYYTPKQLAKAASGKGFAYQ